MRRRSTTTTPKSAPQIRCAIYTRKSTEEGLEQEFNTLDAQRESAEAYITSQQHEGWTCVPDRYDDGGFTGGNMERPAIKRLLADIEAGKVNCVVVYKVDRLSRSLLDFAKMMETFQRHNVSFVSVTQQFNTSTPMGRLMLHVLLSFAQFEREIISERTRDKIAAARRKGRWSGGRPLLGYDVVETKLVVNRLEAERVREIFALYLKHRSLMPVVEQLAKRSWRTKQWTTRKGQRVGGLAFGKNSLYQMLTNVTYIGKVRYKDEVHEGQHEAIVDVETFRRVQALLQENGRSGGAKVRNVSGALLRGLVRCVPCGCAMHPTYSAKGSRRYRYYVCGHAQQHGWGSCPEPSIPAGQIEQFVIEQIRAIGRDKEVVRQTAREARAQVEETVAKLKIERAGFEQQARDDSAEISRLSTARRREGDLARLAELQERLRVAEQRISEITQEVETLTTLLIDDREVADALASFDPLWQSLTPAEQAQLIHLLVEKVEFDGTRGMVTLRLQPTGIKALYEQTARSGEDAA